MLTNLWYSVVSKLAWVIRKITCQFRMRAGIVPVQFNPATKELEFLLIQDRLRRAWILPGTKVSETA